MFSNETASPGKRVSTPAHANKFTEGNFYKQVVTFQSGRGQLINDAAILKSSINQVNQRSDRKAFIRARMQVNGN